MLLIAVAVVSWCNMIYVLAVLSVMLIRSVIRRTLRALTFMTSLGALDAPLEFWLGWFGLADVCSVGRCYGRLRLF